MRPTAADQCEHRRITSGIFLALALVSAALIAYEIVLMRRLVIERWHHFGYLVISVALLGFGASGTLLALIERRVRARPELTMYWLAVALVVALLGMPRLATLLPVAARFIPDDLGIQAGWWSLYWVAALLPFLIGAALLGAAMMVAGRHVGRVYAANLFGSAAGAAGAVLVISYYPVESDLWPSSALALAAVVILARHAASGAGLRAAVGVRVVLLLTMFAIVVGIIWPLPASYDQHKYAARLGDLVAQGSAGRVAARADAHGYVELFESDLFHDLPFLNLSELPPSMYSLVVNGDPAGSVLRISDIDQAGVLDGTLMAFPYRLIRPQPRVLLVGETGGTNVWLARRRDASWIEVVQPNRAIVSLVGTWSKPVFQLERGSIRSGDPRAFLASRAGGSYDLIQIVSLEGLGAGTAGMRGLAEDHLATVEGFADGLRALSDDGVLAISRGIQQPPRENIRIFAVLVEALELLGVDAPARHVVQVRDFLGVCTIASRTPLTEGAREKLRFAIREFNLTPVWYDGLPIEEVNQPDTFAGPSGTRADWLHHAAREILSPRRTQFYDSWLLNVQPPHDDNPFFWDFYKPQAIAELKRVYGDLWLTRAELGRLFLYASLLIAAGAAVVLILVPLGILEFRRHQSEPRALATGQNVAAAPRGGRDNQESTAHRAVAHGESRHGAQAQNGRTALAAIVYFTGIGLGFMGIEMALISRAIRWLGDPVIATAFVIAGVLVVSGLGSLTGRRLVRDRTWLAPTVVAVVAGVVRLVGWNTLGEADGGPWLLLSAALAVAYFMGMPMPAGIRALSTHGPRLIPWAWGVNGVASVVATSAAIVIAMTAGYRTVVILAAAAYALAALAATPLTGLCESCKRQSVSV